MARNAIPATAKFWDEDPMHLRRRVGMVFQKSNPFPTMHQAARCSDRTAFFYMGKLIEYGETRTVFMNPSDPQTEAYVSGRFG